MPSGTVTPAGGGGSSAAATVRGPYLIVPANLTALRNGVAFYTPTVGDLLLDVWFEVDTVFNSAAQADVSQYTGTGTPNGLFGWFVNPVDLAANADTLDHGGGPLTGIGARVMSLAQVAAIAGNQRLAPARFITADPLLLVVSADGNKGGSGSAATAGAARLYIVTATPVAF